MIEKILIISPSQSLFRVSTLDRIQKAKKIEHHEAENDQKMTTWLNRMAKNLNIRAKIGLLINDK